MAELFHRPALAKNLAKQVLHPGASSAASSGVFVAAPRRTGKSTFVREDLRPAFEAEDASVVYADLWANPSADPGTVIVAAIRAALATSEGALLRLFKGAGLSKVQVGGAFSFDLDRLGLGKEVSLTDALVALSDETKKMIVLIIDEAQHAITTKAGINTLFALKAARDELNSSQHFGLRILCTGSNQDKLAMLRNGKDQAFFGAPMVKFPMLGKDFVEWFCQKAGLAAELDAEKVWPLFIEAGYRPELLGAAADQIRFDFEADAKTVFNRFSAEVRRLAEEMNNVQRKVVHNLTPIQQAVLRVMAAAGPKFAPFEAATLDKYRIAMQSTGVPAEEVKIDVPSAQQALYALQEKKLVWKASRGVYDLEEQSLKDILAAEGLLKDLD
ncbi:MAG: hypothetical protein JWP38_2641 [Herbaspirillum sp.]|jgi:hypothetical protein|nr:hypothetical protein [Herbaspirillum sp.]